jgi:hypothetical protein
MTLTFIMSPSSNSQVGSDRVRLLERTTCRTIRAIRARELEWSLAVIAAARVEVRGMIREGEQVFPKPGFEPGPRGIELRFGLLSPHLGSTRELRVSR